MIRVYARRIGLLGLSGLMLAAMAPVTAQESGLGARWPNASDVSKAPGFHAYRWDRGGIAFVQVSDGAGEPILAIAVARNGVLVLPVGNPDRVRVIRRLPSGLQSLPAGPVVYADAGVEISQEGDGYAVRPLQATDVCTDPVECGKPMAADRALPSGTASSLSLEEPCTDPVECGKPRQ